GSGGAGGATASGSAGGQTSTSTTTSTFSGTGCDLLHPDACGSGAYCSIPSCIGAGTCVKVQGDPLAYAPVCGCDKLDYWNGAVAGDQKAPVRATGRCPLGTPCTQASGSCKVGQVQGYCDITVPTLAQCNPPLPPPGTCMVLPADCMNVPGAGIRCS